METGGIELTRVGGGGGEQAWLLHGHEITGWHPSCLASSRAVAIAGLGLKGRARGGKMNGIIGLGRAWAVIDGGNRFWARGTRGCHANVARFCYPAAVRKGKKSITKARMGENTKNAGRESTSCSTTRLGNHLLPAPFPHVRDLPLCIQQVVDPRVPPWVPGGVANGKDRPGQKPKRQPPAPAQLA
jgi:hypothetical protein